VEHRYFGTSRPDSLDWEHLTVEQAANDHHRVVEFFKKIYPGKWVSTGISKGGQTSLFFKYYFPDDVDATIAYVAPMNLEREDARISRFIRQQGGEECYRRITEFQRALLSKRDVILPLLEQQRREKNLQFFLPDEEMLEYAILEFPFSFWQWHSGDCNSIPDSTVEADSLLAYLLKVVPPGMYSVQAYERLQPAFYQFYSQLGYYDFSYNAPSVFDLLTAVRQPTNEVFLKPELRKPFDKQLMPRIHRWLSQQGKHIITIYGANDPWSASALVFDATSENLSIFKPGGNHRTRISDLPEELQQQVFERLSRWLKMSVPDTSRMNKAA
ncbi:MAG: peptidase, partial [Calditrichaeota bacterium]